MSFRSDVRDVVDPMFIRFREEMYGSGVSFGRIIAGKLPTTVVYTTNINETINNIIIASGYIKGITTLSGTTQKGTDQKELSFINLNVTVSGIRTTVTWPDPLTTIGDVLYRNSSNINDRLPIGTSGYILTSDGSRPRWLPSTGNASDPTTSLGDLIYRETSALDRLPIGNAGDILTVSGSRPVWKVPASGTGSSLTVRARDNFNSVSAAAIAVPEGTLRVVGTTAHIFPGMLPLDVPPATAHAKDDEFGTSSLDAKWTDPATSTAANTITIENSWLTLEPATAGVASTGQRGGFAIRQNAPTGAFTITAKTIDGSSISGLDDARAGIFVGISGNSSVGHILGRQNSIPRQANANDFTYKENADWTGAIAYDQVGITTNVNMPVWFKITYLASGLSFYYSMNGMFWTFLATRLSQAQPDRIGIAIWGNSANIYADHKIGVDWFRVTEP